MLISWCTIKEPEIESCSLSKSRRDKSKFKNVPSNPRLLIMKQVLTRDPKMIVKMNSMIMISSKKLENLILCQPKDLENTGHLNFIH